VSSQVSSPNSVVEVPHAPGVDIEQQRVDDRRQRDALRVASRRQREELFRVVDVLGDGDCMFRAVTRHVFRDEDYRMPDGAFVHRHLRMAAAGFMALHWDHYQMRAVRALDYDPPPPYHDRWSFVEWFGGANEWASMTEVHALANVLGVRIRVWHHAEAESIHYPDITLPDADPESLGMVEIYYIPNHFQALVLRNPGNNPTVDEHVAEHSWFTAVAAIGILCTSAWQAGSMWYGHDMSVWPPTNIVSATGVRATLSWMLMPLILDALQVRCPLFPFQRTDRFRRLSFILGSRFRANEITWESLQSHLDGPFHLTAEMQEQLIDLLPEPEGWDLLEYVVELQEQYADELGL
jgi:hypothetical protein